MLAASHSRATERAPSSSRSTTKCGLPVLRQVFNVRNEYPPHQKEVILLRESQLLDNDIMDFEDNAHIALSTWAAKKYPVSAHIMVGGLALSLMIQGLTWDLHSGLFTGLLKVSAWSFLAFVFAIEVTAAKSRFRIQEIRRRRRQVEVESFENELNLTKD